MTKIRIVRTQTLEFEPKPEHYAPGMTARDMLEAEISNASDDGDGYFQDATNSVTGEVIEGGETAVVGFN